MVGDAVIERHFSLRLGNRAFLSLEVRPGGCADMAFQDIIPSDSCFNGKKIGVEGEETFCGLGPSPLCFFRRFLVGFHICAKARDDFITELVPLSLFP